MRIYSMETLRGEAAEAGDTVVLSQKFSHGHRRVRAFAMALAGFLLCLPLGMVLASSVARTRLVELAASQPAIALQLAGIAALGLTALYFGISELRRPVVEARIIELGTSDAIVDDTLQGSTHRWQAPLSAFIGIRHRVFTTSGGTIHTLLLEHAQPTRSLHIAYETYIANQTIVDAARRYDLPILEPASLSLRKRWWRSLSPFLGSMGRTPNGDRQTAST